MRPMKRAIHIVFWLSLAMGIAVVLLRKRGEEARPAPPPEAAPRLAPALTIPDAKIDTMTDTLAPPDATKTAERKTTLETEADFLKKIKDNVRANPELALALARQARQAFGDSAQSDERDKSLVDALINLQKIGAARDETLYYYQHHPAGQYRQYLWSMTGARPEPPAGPAPK